MALRLTSAQARALLENVYQQHPERWRAAVQTILDDLYRDHERLALVFDQLLRDAQRLYQQVQGGGVAPAPGTPRYGADGRPLSPEQAAIEAEMDAAIGAQEEERRQAAAAAAQVASAGAGAPSVGGAPPPPGSPPRPRPAGRPGRPPGPPPVGRPGAPPRPAAAPPTPNGTFNDGTPWTPEQAAAEAQMDAAVAAAGPSQD